MQYLVALVLVVLIIVVYGFLTENPVVILAALALYFCAYQMRPGPVKQGFESRYYSPPEPVYPRGETGERVRKDYILNENGEIITMKQAPLGDPFCPDNGNAVFQEQLKRQRMTNNPVNGVGRVDAGVYADFVTPDPPWHNIALDQRTLGIYPDVTSG